MKHSGALFSRLFAGDVEVVTDYVVYVGLLGTCVLGASQAYFLNVGLSRFDSLDFVPKFTVLMMLLGGATGLVFDQEYTLLTPLGWGMFLFGVLLLCVALRVLSMRLAALNILYVEVIRCYQLLVGECERNSIS